MPMIPTYNGNIPMVASQGGVSGGVAHAVMPQVNPQAALAGAERTGNEAAGALTKLAQMQYEMESKAAVDDADTQAMELINRELMDPKTGYLAQNGRNAMVGYQDAMDRIRQGLNKITESAAPHVRRAVQPKMNDRLAAAMGRANQHRLVQTQRYMVDSARTNLSMLVTDYAEHFDDKEYGARTLGSAWEKVKELGGMLGWDEQQVEENARAQYDLMESKRYSRWAQVDPIGALADLQTNRSGISPDIKGKLQQQLFMHAKDLLVESLGDYSPEGRITVGTRTGNPIIDALAPDQKIQVLKGAFAKNRLQNAIRNQEFDTRLKNSLAEFADNGTDENALSADQFVERFGPQEGAKRYAAYQLQCDVLSNAHAFQTMDAEGISQTVEAMRPTPGAEDYAVRSKAFKAVQQAAGQVLQSRAKDPVGALVDLGINGVAPLDFSQPGKIGEQLKARNDQLADNARFLGVPVADLMTKQEAAALTQILDKSDTDQKVALMSMIGAGAGQEALARIAQQVKGDHVSYSLAMAGMNEFPDGGTVSVGEKYLRGKDYIGAKIVKMDPSAETGTKARLARMLESDGTDEGVFPNSQTRDDAVELAFGVLAYRMGRGQGVSVDGAMKEAIGEILSHNRKKIVVPRGVPGSKWVGADFSTAVKNYAAKNIATAKSNFYAGGDSITPSQLASELPRLQLQTLRQKEDGSVDYAVLRNGRYVTRRTADGKGNVGLVITIDRGMLE
ncbi:MAG: hypothetical protein IJ164_04375 [Duodenibacillus sp.]|nr:hypothetical protein [Duodenibacillus sp.]